MKKYYRIFTMLAVVFSLTLSSCKDFLDINRNPNYLTEASCATLLPSACVSTVAQLGYNGDLLGMMFNQYCTQGNTTNQYNTAVTYALTTSSYTGFWTNAYGATLPDLKLLVAQAEEKGEWNYWLIGKVLQAYNWHILADIYEDIPFTEALNADEYPYPNYDSGKTVVYPAIITMLNDAIAKESAASAKGLPIIDNKDFFFKGDISKWVAFAKSLKLKVLMRDFDANKTAIQSLLSDGGLLEEDCAVTCWEDATNKGNPLYESNIRQLNTQENIRGCHTFIEYMIANDDIRLENIYEPTYTSTITGGTTLRERFEGLPYGTKPESSGDEGVPIVNSSRWLQAYDDPTYIMNKAEAYLQVAEAYARLDNVEKAKENYDKGVLAGFERYGKNGSSYIAEGGVYEFDPENMMECIMMQKWICYAKANSWDGWFDRNRTGIPALAGAITVRVSDADYTQGLSEGYVLGNLVDPGTNSLQSYQIPRRMMIPTSSSQYNPNAPETKALDEPMWWQVARGK